MVNKLTYYLGAQVVQQDNPKDQTKVITQIIKIGKVTFDRLIPCFFLFPYTYF